MPHDDRPPRGESETIHARPARGPVEQGIVIGLTAVTAAALLALVVVLPIILIYRAAL